MHKINVNGGTWNCETCGAGKSGYKSSRTALLAARKHRDEAAKAEKPEGMTLMQMFMANGNN